MHSMTIHPYENSVFCLPEAAALLLEPVFLFHPLLSMLLPGMKMLAHRDKISAESEVTDFSVLH